MLTYALDRPSRSTMRNKVPEITLYFWTIKVLSTTVGETAADLLAIKLNLGLTVTSLVTTALFAAVLAFQLKARDYVPPLYWATVVLISVVGTLVSDNLVDGYGISLVSTSVIFGVVLALVFALWYRSERTLSIHSIVTERRELFYWAAILFTFALGTSLGDLLAEGLDLGYAQAALVFAGMIAVVAGVYYGAGINGVLTFWVAYILTRPLGASIGDWLAKPVIADGLGLGTLTTSLIFLAVILVFVLYLTMSKADRIAEADAGT